jgi:hypothetical protein
LSDNLGPVLRLGPELLKLLLFIAHAAENFIKVDRLKELHLLGHVLQLVQPLHFGLFEVHKLVLLQLLELEFVPEPLEHLVLRCYFLLCPLELVL